MIPLTWQRACENQEKVLTHLLDQITTKDEAIAELNTRCSSHLISMMNLASRLTLEVAKWKLRYRHACREMLRSTAERLHLNEQTHLLRKFLKP